MLLQNVNCVQLHQMAQVITHFRRSLAKPSAHKSRLRYKEQQLYYCCCYY